MAGAGNISYASSALHTKAIAAYKSVLHAAQLGMSTIILETDSIVLANALKSPNLDRSIIGALVVQIRDIMQIEFSFCDVSLCNRSCNKVADALAVHGAYVLESGSDVLMSHVPLYVMNLVSGDLPKNASVFPTLLHELHHGATPPWSIWSRWYCLVHNSASALGMG